MTNEELKQLLYEIPHGDWIYHTAGRDTLVGIGIIQHRTAWNPHERVETLCEIVGITEERRKAMIQAALLWTIAPTEIRRLLQDVERLERKVEELEKKREEV